MSKAIYILLVISLGLLVSWIPSACADNHTESEVLSREKIVENAGGDGDSYTR